MQTDDKIKQIQDRMLGQVINSNKKTIKQIDQKARVPEIRFAQKDCKYFNGYCVILTSRDCRNCSFYEVDNG